MSLAEFRHDFPLLCDRLLQVRARKRTGHAYLFIGDDPEFLEKFVNAWARVCACASPEPGGEACGQCSACRMLALGSYPERTELRAESKARRIKVEQVREFEKQLYLAAGDHRLKIGVVAEADCMGEEAQNAFLKTLEEPPGATLLLLYTTQPRRLLPTIRSRCQTVSLLRNRRNYGLAHELGLFALLRRLERNAGATVALSVAHGLAAILESLRLRAEETVGNALDERWEAVASDDAKLKEQLEEQREARVAAEYRRLRASVEDAIQCWFLQECLRAAGLSAERLPCPELLSSATQRGEPLPGPSWDDAEQNIGFVQELLECLAANVNEPLALDAFCLAVCEKRPSGSPSGKKTAYQSSST